MIDYACTGDDWSMIENIMSEPNDKRHLVNITDVYLKTKQLVRLLTPGEYVGDEVSICSFMTRRCYFNVSSYYLL